MMSKSTNNTVRSHCNVPLNVSIHPKHLKSFCIDMTITYRSKIRSEIIDVYSCFFLSAVNAVRIKSYPIALTCRFIQFLIFVYTVGYAMWYQRDYQDHDVSVVSSVILKLQTVEKYDGEPTTAFDNALFIMTNSLTFDQEQTLCAESISSSTGYCTDHFQCQPELQNLNRGNGLWTGRCLLPENRCEIRAWCPVDNYTSAQQVAVNALNHSIHVSNFIEFSRFGVRRTNILNNSFYFHNCYYDSLDNQYCPIFRIGDILEIVEPNNDERTKMFKYGGVIRMKIDWMCNLDLDEDQCLPKYSFGRLDSKYVDEQFSVGFKFRYATHWTTRKRSFRTLRKVVGLRLVVIVHGDAGRFDLFVLTRRIGSMIGTLSIAIFICDVIALYFTQHGNTLQRHKFLPNSHEHPPVSSI